MFTIEDTSDEQTGTVINTYTSNAAGGACVFNEGTVVINGGTYYHSNASSSWYVVVNHGTMTINDGTFSSSNSSGMIENGYYSYYNSNICYGYIEGTNAQYPELTINGGTFEKAGSSYAIKNDDGGYLVINDCTINVLSGSSASCLLNWNVAEINGGEFNNEASTCVIYAGSYDDDIYQGILTISGGTFTCVNSGAVLFKSDSYADNDGVMEITGGLYIGSLLESGVTSYAILNIVAGVFSDGTASDFVDSTSVGAVVSSTGYTYVGIYESGDEDDINTILNDVAITGADADTVTVTGIGEELSLVALTDLTCVTVINTTDTEVTINGLTATEEGTCTHPYAEKYGQEATCTEGGTIDYWYCSECDSYFSDEDCQTEISSDDLETDALGHLWCDPVWSWSDDYSTATAVFTCERDSSHVESVETTAAEDQDSEGNVIYTASVEFEGNTYTDTKETIAVYIDEELDMELIEGQEYTFPETESEEGIYLYYNEETGYIAKGGSTIEAYETVYFDTVEISLSTTKGASILVDTSMDKDYAGAIRFQANVTISAHEELLEDNDVLTVGMLLTTIEDFQASGEELTLDSSNIIDMVNSSAVYSESGDTFSFCTTIRNISYRYYNQAYVANTYVTVNLSDGTSTTLYGNVSNTDGRSVAYVAYLNVYEYDYLGFDDEDQQEMLRYFASFYTE